MLPRHIVRLLTEQSWKLMLSPEAVSRRDNSQCVWWATITDSRGQWIWSCNESGSNPQEAVDHLLLENEVDISACMSELEEGGFDFGRTDADRA